MLYKNRNKAGNYRFVYLLGLSLIIMLAQTIMVTPSALAGGPLCVSPDGNDNGNCDCSDTFQHCRGVERAMGFASNGDTIRVAEGNYGASQPKLTEMGTEALIDIDKEVTLEGGWNSDFTSRDSSRYETTILDGENNRRVIYITGDITPTIDGFLITQGSANYGGGIYVLDSHPIIKNSTVANSQAINFNNQTSGGGILLYNADYTQILSSTIHNNKALYNGGGIGITKDSSNLLFQNVKVTDNQASISTLTPSNYGGGGIYFNEDENTLLSVVLRDVTITGNSVANGQDYGGLYLMGQGATLQDVVIQENSADDEYGGFYINGDDVSLSNVQVISNSSVGDYSGGYLDSENAMLSNITIINNITPREYAGLHVQGNNLTLSQVLIQSNRAGTNTSYSYGGLSIVGNNANLSNVTIDNNYSADNYASLYLQGTFPSLSNIIATNNVANDGVAGIYIDADSSSTSQVTMTDVYIYNNSSKAGAPGAGGLYIASGTDATAKVTLENGSIIGNSHTANYAGLYISGHNAVISNVDVLSNSTTTYYGGLYVNSSDAVLDSLTVRNNQATESNIANDGGGIYLTNFDNGVLRSSIIMDNVAYSEGGGLYIDSGSTDYRLENNIIAHNSINTGGDGSGLYLAGGNGQIIHNTIVNNTGGNGQALYITGNGFQLRNSIIATHTLAVEMGSGSIAISKTVFANSGSPGYDPAGLVTANSIRTCTPPFVDVSNKDYHLAKDEDSCAIDFGDNLSLTDIDGNPRNDGLPDAGADERSIPIPDFVGTPTSGISPLTVAFDSSSSTGDIEGYLWDFGDSYSSTVTNTILANPTYVYTNGGSYTVTLTLTNSAGAGVITKTSYITAYNPCVADFSGSPTAGPAGTVVSFTNSSTGDCDSWDWDFGDSSTHSSSMDDSRTYTNTGIYTVSLVASGSGGVATKTNSITICAAPTIDFSADQTTGESGLIVTFTDNSTPADGTCAPSAWLWDFGDGQVSSEQNMTHTYTSTGTFDVSLVVTGTGGTETMTQTGYIRIGDIAANFDYSLVSGLAPLPVLFTSTSTSIFTITQWQWSSDTTVIGSQETLSYTFDQAGIYDVKLTITDTTNQQDSMTKTVTVYEPVMASCSFSPITGTAPLTVVVNSNSTGSYDQLTWHVGGEIITNTSVITYVFTEPDSYTITLTADGSGGSDTAICDDGSGGQDITVNAPLAASFTSIANSGIVPFTVTFTNTSEGVISSYLWNFGDGTDNMQQHPTHVYTNKGNYTVTLTVSGPDGSDVATETIAAYKKCVADFSYIQSSEVTQTKRLGTKNRGGGVLSTEPLTITLQNQSTGDCDSFGWDFGDGGYSNEQNPTYTYTLAGSYNITLTASGSGGIDSIVKVGPTVYSESLELNADFTSSLTSSSPNSSIQFTDKSTGTVEIESWLWQFGDGLTHTVRYPTHVYTTTGVYTVSLTISGQGQTDTVTKTSFITIANSIPQLFGVVITPTEPTVNETLVVTYTFFDTDGDTENASLIRWRVEGVGERSDYDNQTTIPPEATTVGETWCATVQPYDGKEYGEAVEAGCVTIISSSTNQFFNFVPMVIR
ncbi:PKD domain-containing protein [Anaerolineales bacterium HSG6]|nr:PKD domain-containing protein [Anaerolineales bacterium HSG6]MDM8532676.1 PKD domain-containing protein [Anaerolineales bacterium HSG25]